MSNLAIVYFSETGVTHELALAVKKGAYTVSGVSVNTHRIDGSEISLGRFVNTACLELVDNADAVIFGSPTYMGGPAAQFKAFADASSDHWDDQRWSGKVAAGFTVGCNPGGDQLATLQYFTILAAQHSMLWLGLDLQGGGSPEALNPQGTQMGLAAYVPSMPIRQNELDTASYLGARVSTYISRN